MPSAGKGKRKKNSKKKSELDSALEQVGDESVAAAITEFQDLLGQAKGDTSELVRQNAQELERRLILLKNGEIDKEDFDFFVEKPEARSQGICRQPAGAGAGTHREIDVTHSGDSCDESCAGIDRNDLVAAASPHFARSAVGVRCVVA
jgi:hypothetical protein